MRKTHALPIAIIGIMASLLLLQAEGTSLPSRLSNSQASEARSTERDLSGEGASVQHGLRFSDQPRDYVLSQSSPPQVLAAVADGELVTYIAFDGAVYQLRQYTGAHTAILIKPEDLDRYTLPSLQELLDRCDLWYAYYKEITQSDPDGEGVDPIAFVKPFGEALGRGRLGQKGVEIDPVALHSESGPQAVVIHELGHNFDKYSTVSMVGPDTPHVWTGFCEPYIAFYSRGAVDPVGAFDQRIDLILNVYLSDPAATWEACIRDSLCGPLLNSNILQSSVVLRAVQLFGPAVVTRWLERMREASRSLNPSRMSPLDKSDVFADTLSRAVNADLSCFFDYLRWPVSDSLRSNLQRRFESSAVCIDRDNDGYSLLAGDCDDANPAINPGADEVANGIDDDCNRVVDDFLFGEAGGDFPNTTASALRLSIPCKVEGVISSTADFDQFQINSPTESTILFSPRAIGGFSGWIYYYQQGSGQVKDFSYFPEGSFSDVTLTVPAGSWNVAIAVASPPNFGHYPTALGSYEIKIQSPVAAQNLEPVIPPPARTVHFNDYILTASVVPQALSDRPDVMARFWVSKFGWVGAVPAFNNKEASFEWLAPQGMETGSLWYRVQYYQNSLPLTGITLPAPIITEHDPVSGPVINSVSFDGRKTMTISGVRFGDSPQVIINYVDRSSAIKKVSDTGVTLKKKAKKLGLKPGDNLVQVYTSNGSASNVITLRL